MGDKEFAPALERLERDARQALGAGPFTVTRKDAVPPSGDKHDYVSFAPYFWPNPATSNGLPYVRRDGERNPDIYRISDRRELSGICESVPTLALAYFFTTNEAYATRAAELLRVWFLDPATRMNPNLEFGQGIPGTVSGRGFGLIETRGFADIIDGVGLLKGSKAWTASDQSGLELWFSQFLDWMLTSKKGRDEAAAKNNHGTFYDVQVICFAQFVGKRDLARRVLEEAREKRIAVQIEPDGRQPLELARTRSWSYSVSNLGGLVSLACLGEGLGVDLWRYEAPGGRSIRNALAYLAPYALSGKEWPDRQLGGVNRSALHPLIRRAAVHDPLPLHREWARRVPSVDPASRTRLVEVVPPRVQP
jgi:hypothetical protein